MPGANFERIFAAAAVRHKYHIIRERIAANDTSLQVEDLKDLRKLSWLLSPDEHTKSNQWVLGFREDCRMLALRDCDGRASAMVPMGAIRSWPAKDSNEYASKLKKTRLVRTTWRRTT